MNAFLLFSIGFLLLIGGGVVYLAWHEFFQSKLPRSPEDLSTCAETNAHKANANPVAAQLALAAEADDCLACALCRARKGSRGLHYVIRRDDAVTAAQLARELRLRGYNARALYAGVVELTW